MRYNDKIPFKMETTFGGNQIDGIILCKEASETLGIIIE
jgi:hypothetical protein